MHRQHYVVEHNASLHNRRMDWQDRQAETARLDRLAGRRDGGFGVLWGRRRVGKTRFLVEWVARRKGAYFVADESTPVLQRQRFAEAVAAVLPGFGEVEYRDWGTLLGRLAREAMRASVRGPFVIDELPYLVMASPELPATLQRFLDHEAKQAKLVLVVAGSSQRMMQGLVLDPRAPLFGRASEAFEIRPLAPRWLGPALGLRAPLHIVSAWNVWGGLPRYWELAAEFADRRTAVDGLVLDPSGPLHDEPSRLLLEELPPAIGLRPILDAIGSGGHRVSEIAGRIGTPATSLARSMTRLVELGLVVRETPFGEPERSTKRAVYKLADPFLRLWFSLVAPKRAMLAQIGSKARLALFDERAPHLDAASWEDLCRAVVPRLADALGAPFGPAQRYWGGSGPEWDVVASTRSGKLHLLGEVKWSPQTATAELLSTAYTQLMARGTPPFVRGEVVRALFVPVLPRTRPKSLPREVRLIDAATLLEVAGGDDV
ncbi:MAG: ATP-binding protein [Planctomycetes bacterium]|nr:ATP-binding protein [Planctomycetota bacterium]